MRTRTAAPADDNGENGKNGQQWLIRRDEPQLIRKGGRDVSSQMGVYSHAVAIKLMMKYPSKLITPSILTATMFGVSKVSDDDLVRYVSAQMWRTINILLGSFDTLAFMVYDDEGHHAIEGMKLLDKKNARDLELFTVYHERMLQRQDQADWKVDTQKALMKKEKIKL